MLIFLFYLLAILAESPLKFDFQFSSIMLGLLICCLIFPFIPNMQLALFDGMLVTAVESVQALFLLSAALFSFVYICAFELSRQQKKIWLWSVAWWLVLFGRSISWRRDYFPEIPKIYFRGVSIALISPVVLMLCSAELRQEIKYKFKNAVWSLWAIAFAIGGLVISDGIEHGRLMVSWLLSDLAYKDLLEELYEFPLIIGLFLIALPLLQRDCVRKNVRN